MDSCNGSCTVVPLTSTEDEHKKRGQSISYKRGLAYFTKPKVLNQIRDHSVQSPARTEIALQTTLLTISENLSFFKLNTKSHRGTNEVRDKWVCGAVCSGVFFFGFFFFFHT